MVIPLKVKPGDPITAKTMDDVIDALIDLNSRLAVLEASGHITDPVAIFGVTAPNPARVGDRIEISGKGFLVPAILNQVTMGGQPVAQFALSSGSTKLAFDIPSIPGLSAMGTPVKVVVTNANGTATSPDIIVSPAVSVPQGRIDLFYKTAPVMPGGAPNISSGGAATDRQYIFTFSLTAIADIAGNYAVTTTPPAAGWTAVLLEDSGLTARASNVVPLAGNIAGTQKDLRILVTVAAGAAGGSGGPLRIAIAETTPGTKVTPGNGATPDILVGSPPPTPENRVRVTLTGAGLGAGVSGTRVVFTRNSLGAVGFNALLTAAVPDGRSYAVAASLRNPTGWSAITVDIPSFGRAAGNANQPLNLQLTANSGAVDTDLLFTITGTPPTGGSPDIVVTYILPVLVS